MTCSSCLKPSTNTRTVVVNGVYYPGMCDSCLTSLKGDSSISSGSASFDRRRQYEDHAQDTVQPYTASGPNPEFFRLYPEQAKKMFSHDVIEQLKKKI